jgi:hypothetical protein
MIYRCCLCDAADGAIKEGRIKDGEGVPLCARHRADLRWTRREQRPPVPLPVSHRLAYERVMMQAATGARSATQGAA